MTVVPPPAARPNRSCFTGLLSLTGFSFLFAGGLVALFLILWGAGAILIIADPLEKMDAVAVLSGGGLERMEEAAKIYQDKLASYVILTDPGVTIPNTGESVPTENKTQAAELGIPSGAILVTEEHANSTSAEARELRRYLEAHQIKSCIVVTDPYHSFRTLLIFRQEFSGSEVEVAVRPVRGHWYRSPTWFLSQRGWQATISEYAKITAFLAGLEGR